MIDGSKKQKSLAGVEVQSRYVIKRRSNLKNWPASPGNSNGQEIKQKPNVD